MSDLSEVLPHFDLKPWKHMTFSLEKKGISTAELITRDPKFLAKTIPLPLREVERMARAIINALHKDMGVNIMPPPSVPGREGAEPPRKRQRTAPKKSISKVKKIQFISALDLSVDQLLGGGVPAGYVTEVVGESAVGKSQFVHALLLSATMPHPQGLGKAALYVTTEDNLMTTRLEQMLQTHPLFEDMPENDLPNCNLIYTTKIHNFTEQEHMLESRLPVEVDRQRIGLVVIDSVAAHFRVQFPGNNLKVLIARSAALTRLGAALRKLAHGKGVAVVVTNQVADRFDDIRAIRVGVQTAKPTPSSSGAPSATAKRVQPSNPVSQAYRDEVMSLDHQQRFFTGWGDDLSNENEKMKTPALGLTWANQLDARIVLKMVEEYNTKQPGEFERKRFMSVVFAKWTAPTRFPLQYELQKQGLVGMPEDGVPIGGDHDDLDGELETEAKNDISDEDAKFLDPMYWADDVDLDEEIS